MLWFELPINKLRSNETIMIDRPCSLEGCVFNWYHTIVNIHYNNNQSLYNKYSQIIIKLFILTCSYCWITPS